MSPTPVGSTVVRSLHLSVVDGQCSSPTYNIPILSYKASLCPACIFSVFFSLRATPTELASSSVSGVLSKPQAPAFRGSKLTLLGHDGGITNDKQEQVRPISVGVRPLRAK